MWKLKNLAFSHQKCPRPSLLLCFILWCLFFFSLGSSEEYVLEETPTFDGEVVGIEEMDLDTLEKKNTNLFACYKWTPYTLDATGKMPSSLLKGNMDFQGDFDECFEHGGLYTLAAGVFRIVPLAGSNLFNGSIPYPMRWGVCLPTQCNVPAFVRANGLQTLSKYVSGGGFYFKSVKSIKVTLPEEEPLTGSGIAFIVVISLILFFVVLGSLYDFFQKEENQDYYFGWLAFFFPSLSKRDDEMLIEEANEERGERGETIPLLDKVDEEKGLMNQGDTDADIIEYNPPSCTEKLSQMGTGSLMAFSLFQTFKEFTTVKFHPQTACLDGFRVFSMFWVICGHTYINLAMSGVYNLLDVGELRSRFLFQFVGNGTFSVDVFFVLSGFLMTLLMSKILAKTKGKVNWVLTYFHRWWRLSPLYYLTIFYGIALLNTMSQGPFSALVQLGTPCQKVWYWNLLYLNNLLPYGGNGNLCLVWTFYLALDMQFFLIAVPIVWLLHYRPRDALIVIGILGLIGYVVTMTLIIEKGYTMDDFLILFKFFEGGDDDMISIGTDEDGGEGGGEGSAGTDDYQVDVYGAPWARIHPYFIGMLAGYWAYLNPKPISLCLWQQLSGFFVSFMLMCILLYSAYWAYDYTWSTVGDVFYLTFARSIFGLGMALLVLLCYSGNGGFINWFFSWYIWQMMSKLTYAVYMFHFIVMVIYFTSFRHLPRFSDADCIMYFFAVSVITFVIAFGVHLCIELPFARLEKALLSPFVKV